MTELLVWLVICFATALVLSARPMASICLVVLLWIGVPAVAGGLLTGLSGGAFAFHPATWLVITIVLVQLLRDAAPLVSALAQHIYLFLIMFVFAAGAFITSRYTGSHGTTLLFDQIVGPALLTWLVLAYGEGKLEKLRLLRNTILFGAAAEAILSIIQFGAKNILVYTDSYAQLYWFNPDTFDRWMGTTDSPLVLSLLVCVAAGLSIGLRRWWLRSLLLLVYLLATFIVQSRTGSGVLVAILLLSIIRANMALWARALSIIVTLVAGWYIASTTLISGLTGRLAYDNGSADARLRALSFVADNVSRYFLTGGGLTSSYMVGRDGGLQTSIESSYLMYVIDTGFLLATCYFGIQIVLLLRYVRASGLRGVAVAATVGVLLQHTFSAIAFTNLCGSLIWAVIAMVVAAAKAPTERYASTSSSVSCADAGEQESVSSPTSAQEEVAADTSVAPASRSTAMSAGL